MKLFAAFSRAYPAQSALVLGALVLASLFEGVGLTTLLPLLHHPHERRRRGRHDRGSAAR